jgi:hypothetical protein
VSGADRAGSSALLGSVDHENSVSARVGSDAVMCEQIIDGLRRNTRRECV